ncbi:MAG: HNH endonuclease, partial [Euryarchaeota archaeon]|nr:HNH endonuclease [Euryarchaeota archaeon]
MTPLLPNPDYYLHNLITMTSSESKRLWRRAIKEHFNCQCVYCGEF